MNLLAIDTSTEYLTLALLYRGKTYTREWHAQQKHAEMALPMVQLLLKETGASWTDIDGLALSVGPGSFTGLRIGCGIVQGLAFGLDVPVVGVNTLCALAADSDGTQVVATIDARMGELYLAGYELIDGDWHEVVETTVCAPDALPMLPAGNWIGVGNGFIAQHDALIARYGTQLMNIRGVVFPHARGVLKLAKRAFEAGQAKPADQLELLYIRNKVALKTSERIKA